MTSALDIINLIQGMTPYLPCSHPFVAAWSSGAFVLGQTPPDISSVPADFVKSFLIMFAFVLALGGGVIWGRRGSKGSPMHIKQPVAVDANVSHAPVYAHQSAVEKLRADMEARTRENLRQHEESAKQLAAVIEAGNERLQSMLNALHEMETRMTKATIDEVRSLHERINPIAEACATHRADIKGLSDRLQHLWEMVQNLWAQVFRKPAPRT